MIDWERISKVEKAIRTAAAVVMAVKLIERLNDEDILGAAVCGLTAVAVLGFTADEIRAVGKTLASYR
ncbi:MAG: hypothetical protein ACE5H2_06620 [Terriglobia bacterium]